MNEAHSHVEEVSIAEAVLLWNVKQSLCCGESGGPESFCTTMRVQGL